MAARPARRRRRNTISRDEAVSKIDGMVAALVREIRLAIWYETALEAGNDLIMAGRANLEPGNHTYRAIAQGLILTIIMCLSKMFDIGSRRVPANKRDVLSIPLLVRLLRQRRCRAALCRRAVARAPQGQELEFQEHCERYLDEALRIYRAYVSRRANVNDLKKMKDLRNARLAHLLNVDVGAFPTFEAVFRAGDVAREFIDHAVLAVTGQDDMLGVFEDEHRADADRFWEAALRVNGEH